jgi:hypothetical protein
MANGFQGSREEWDRLEAPLIALDPTLEAFARQRGLTLGKNHKYPERSLTWGGSVSRLIQIFIAGDQGPTFNLWLCASEDRGGDRFWKQQFLLEAATGGELADGLESRLAYAHEIVASWQPGDLQFATHLRS